MLRGFLKNIFSEIVTVFSFIIFPTQKIVMFDWQHIKYNNMPSYAILWHVTIFQKHKNIFLLFDYIPLMVGISRITITYWVTNTNKHPLQNEYGSISMHTERKKNNTIYFIFHQFVYACFKISGMTEKLMNRFKHLKLFILL